MTETTKRIALHLNVRDEMIATVKVYGSEVVALVDYGVGGLKKYRLPLDTLPPLPQPEPPPQKPVKKATRRTVKQTVKRRTKRAQKDG